MLRQPLLGILLAIVAWLAVPARLVHATTIAVTTTTDELNTDGDCSLREAVRAANTNVAVDACPAGQNDQTDAITVPAGTYTLTIFGDDNDAAFGDLDLRNNTAVDDLVITGAGAATTIIQACAVAQISVECPAGQGIVDRVLDVWDAHVAISGVTIRHGRAPIQNSTRNGSGIRIQRASTQAALTLTDVVVTKNGDAFGVSGIGIEGGGIANSLGVLTLTRVTISDNVANSGGGIANKFNDSFGGYSAVLNMTDSTVSGNVGGGIENRDQATATLTGCTINGNSGGGFRNIGLSTTATLTNCTVSGNESTYWAGGIFNSSATLNLHSSTVTLNHGKRQVGETTAGAGGIYSPFSPVVLRNTIVAGNIHDDPRPRDFPPDCFDGGTGQVESAGFNLVGDGSGCPGVVDGANGDQVGTTAAPIDPKLGPLADNGGPTLTHALLDGSLAIDGGNPATPGSGGTACPTTDQRGETRPSGVACDVGSFEGGSGGAIAATTVKPATGGTAGTVQVRVLGNGFAPGAVVRLVRAGFPAVVGTAADVRATAVTTSLDLRNATPGAWSVEVENPDASVATLTDAFTVVAGGQSDLWVDLVLPGGFQNGRVQSIYVTFGNRGTVDAYGVPLWLAFSEILRFFVPFVVSPPPAQPGQIATDWTRVAIDLGRPPSPQVPENTDTFHFLLPIVPAGSSSAFRIRVKNPTFLEPEDPGVPAFMHIATNLGTPYFQPDLSAEAVAFLVSQAKGYAVSAHGTTTFPADAAIDAYVRTQLAAVVAEGRLAAVANETGNLPVYSLAQLIVDTGQFIAGESATAAWTPGDRTWLARIVAELVGGSVEAYVPGPNPCDGLTEPVAKIFCEEETDPCRHGCPDDAPLVPVLPTPCINDLLGPLGKVLKFLGVKCPEPQPAVPFKVPRDPNHKSGPGGPGGFIDGVTPLSYSVTFENVATATGDAFEVTVTDQLDLTKYDLDTFSLGPISFADKFVPVPPDLKSFSTEIDMRPGVNILVGIDAALDMATGIVTWKFTTLDPATHEFPEDPEDGFLPPNVKSPEGEGEMLFTVSLKPGFGLGTTVCNDASIVFDFNNPLLTNEFCNTIGAPEDCENCSDDDGDTLVDRADPDCAAPANGAGTGVGDAKVGKAVDKCGKTIRKVGAKLASNRLKQLGACEKAVADCVQLKNGDAACLAKAHGTCTKARTALPTAEAKLTAAIATACGEPAVTAANLLAATGLGFVGETGACEGRGVAGLTTVADVAECVRRQHQCAAERVLSAAVPRARELLVLGGFDLGTDFACLETGANGGGSAIAAEKRKALRKCDAAIQKAASKLVAGRAKAADACGAAVFTCLQTKPGDPACVTKAGGTCAKAVAGIPKLEAGFTTTVAKACGASPLVAADLLTSEGLGASALTNRCAQLGIASLATVADVTACLEAQLTCRVDHLLESTTPRLGELLGLGGVALP